MEFRLRLCGSFFFCFLSIKREIVGIQSLQALSPACTCLRCAMGSVLDYEFKGNKLEPDLKQLCSRIVGIYLMDFIYTIYLNIFSYRRNVQEIY